MVKQTASAKRSTLKIYVKLLLQKCPLIKQHKENNLVLSTGLIMWIGHRKEILKLTFS